MNKGYSRTIGYSPLDEVDQDKLRQLIRINKALLDDYLPMIGEGKILVAGAGSGHEAVLVQREFGLKTVGVDLNIDLNSQFPINFDLMLQVGDLTSLAFHRGTFDLVYCYHVLEHVPDHITVLMEIQRVLKPGGVLFIGFPNKNRLVSYIGTSQQASVWDKIKWNLNDYRYRLQGKFDNQHGAHAGFTEMGFIDDASGIYERIDPVRKEYMFLKYPKLRGFLTCFIKLGLDEYVFPSNYFVCIKKGSGNEKP